MCNTDQQSTLSGKKNDQNVWLDKDFQEGSALAQRIERGVNCSRLEKQLFLELHIRGIQKGRGRDWQLERWIRGIRSMDSKAEERMAVKEHGEGCSRSKYRL